MDFEIQVTISFNAKEFFKVKTLKHREMKKIDIMHGRNLRHSEDIYPNLPLHYIK